MVQRVYNSQPRLSFSFLANHSTAHQDTSSHTSEHQGMDRSDSSLDKIAGKSRKISKMTTFQQNPEAVTEQKLNSKEVAKPVDKSDAERTVKYQLC